MDIYPEKIPALRKKKANCTMGGALNGGKNQQVLSCYPGSVFDVIKQISCIKLLPPKHNHAKGEEKKNASEVAQLSTHSKNNGPSLTASAYVVTAHACALVETNLQASEFLCHNSGI